MSETTKIEAVPLKKKRGGYRGGGRPMGSTNKISGQKILETVSQTLGRDYAEQLSINYQECILEGDRAMIAKYDQMFLNKVVADKSQVDMTSNGQTMSAPVLQFVAAQTGQDYTEK